VVCVDEKTQIQALRRPVPGLGMLSGLDRRREWEYQRDGTVNLLVTYTLMTGRLWGRVLLKNDHGHFIATWTSTWPPCPGRSGAFIAFSTTAPRTLRRRPRLGWPHRQVVWCSLHAGACVLGEPGRTGAERLQPSVLAGSRQRKSRRAHRAHRAGTRGIQPAQRASVHVVIHSTCNAPVALSTDFGNGALELTGVTKDINDT
jgi:hypothetical protein